MRAAIKGVIEQTLGASGAVSMLRRRRAGQVFIIAYHNVVPDDSAPAGDLANHLRLSDFVEQLTELVKTHDVVPLSRAVDAAKPGGRPRASITFDDAYRCAVLQAIPELVRRNFPATIFVTPAFLGGKFFWWDALAP